MQSPFLQTLALPLTVGLLQESTSRLYWMTRSSVTTTDKSLALGWYSRPTVPSSTVSLRESSSQKPPMIEKRVKESCSFFRRATSDDVGETKEEHEVKKSYTTVVIR